MSSRRALITTLPIVSTPIHGVPPLPLAVTAVNERSDPPAIAGPAHEGPEENNREQVAPGSPGQSEPAQQRDATMGSNGPSLRMGGCGSLLPPAQFLPDRAKQRHQGRHRIAPRKARQALPVQKTRRPLAESYKLLPPQSAERIEVLARKPEPDSRAEIVQGACGRPTTRL